MQLTSLLKTLVETESPSSVKSAVDRVGVIVAGEARKLGADVQIIQNAETGDHILSKWGNGRDGILLLCHMILFFHSVHFRRCLIVKPKGRSSVPARST